MRRSSLGLPRKSTAMAECVDFLEDRLGAHDRGGSTAAPGRQPRTRRLYSRSILSRARAARPRTLRLRPRARRQRCGDPDAGAGRARRRRLPSRGARACRRAARAIALSARAFVSPSFLVRTRISTRPLATAPSVGLVDRSSPFRRLRGPTLETRELEQLPCVRAREHRSSRGDPRVAPDHAYRDARKLGFSHRALLGAARVAPRQHGGPQLCHAITSIFPPRIRAWSLGCETIAGPRSTSAVEPRSPSVTRAGDRRRLEGAEAQRASCALRAAAEEGECPAEPSVSSCLPLLLAVLLERLSTRFCLGHDPLVGAARELGRSSARRFARPWRARRASRRRIGYFRCARATWVPGSPSTRPHRLGTSSACAPLSSSPGSADRPEARSRAFRPVRARACGRLYPVFELRRPGQTPVARAYPAAPALSTTDLTAPNTAP